MNASLQAKARSVAALDKEEALILARGLIAERSAAPLAASATGGKSGSLEWRIEEDAVDGDQPGIARGPPDPGLGAQPRRRVARRARSAQDQGGSGDVITGPTMLAELAAEQASRLRGVPPNRASRLSSFWRR